jgi:hypothetical protein
MPTRHVNICCRARPKRVDPPRLRSAALTGASAAAHAAVFSEALFSERDVVADGALGEMLPLNVATVAPTTLESPRDQSNSSGRRKF